MVACAKASQQSLCQQVNKTGERLCRGNQGAGVGVRSGVCGAYVGRATVNHPGIQAS